MKRFNFLSKSIVVAFISLTIYISCQPDDSIEIRDISIDGFQPLAALGGDTVTIIGSGFDENIVLNAVEFSGTSKLADVLRSSNDELEVIVPDSALAGTVRVVVGVNSAASQVPFLLSPSISSINPDAALPGAQIVIQGKNFTTNLNRLVIFAGDILVDSIFGGSSSQVVFPLPLGLNVGPTSMKVGTILTANDTVFAPSLPFIVLDPEVPAITEITPRAATPGSDIRLFGNAFKADPDSIFVTLNGIRIGTFKELDDDEMLITIPESIDVSGLGQLVTEITVSVLNSGGETLTSLPVEFTIVEPSDLTFYYTALNVPGFQNRSDDFVYKAEPVFGSDPIITEIKQNNDIRGLDLNIADDELYYVSAAVFTNTLSGDAETILASDPVSISDLVYDDDNRKIYYPSREEGQVYSLDLASLATESLFDINGGFDSNPVESMELDDGTLYYTEGNAVKSYNVFNGNQNTLFTNSSPNKFISVAVSQNLVYIVEGPTQPSQQNLAGNSIIYVGNKDGSGSLQVLYNRPDEIITDLDISSDNQSLYWMVSDGNGGILSAPATGDESQIESIISGIQTGRYLKVVEKE